VKALSRRKVLGAHTHEFPLFTVSSFVIFGYFRCVSNVDASVAIYVRRAVAQAVNRSIRRRPLGRQRTLSSLSVFYGTSDTSIMSVIPLLSKSAFPFKSGSPFLDRSILW